MQLLQHSKGKSSYFILALSFLFVFFKCNFASARSPDKKKRIAFVASEQTGYLNLGGLGHYAAEVPRLLASAGYEVEIIMPLYSSILVAHPDLQLSDKLIEVGVHSKVPALGERSHSEYWQFKDKNLVRIYRDNNSDVTTYFMDPVFDGVRLFDNSHNPKRYTRDDTYGEAFGTFARAVDKFIENRGYDVVILNDWATGLVAPLLDEKKKAGENVPPVLFMLHNLGYQGIFSKDLLPYLGFTWQHFNVNGLEFYDSVNFLKAGLAYSDHVNTVSPTYAREITRPERGHQLESLTQRLHLEGRLSGILNGMDTGKWDPEKPTELTPYTFSPKNLSGKLQGKRFMQKYFGLPVLDAAPVIALTSRLAEQKGIYYLPQAIEAILAENKNVQFVVLGDGEMPYVQLMNDLSQRHPQQLVYKSFQTDDEFTLLTYADFFINAAYYEPSGLNHFYALRNGTVPILSRTGGLQDSAVDGESAYFFDIEFQPQSRNVDNLVTAKNLEGAIRRALDAYANSPQQITRMRQIGMALDHSWAARLPAYIDLIENVIDRTKCTSLLK